jgi:uncharacterized protein (UPF0332 family)
MSDRVQVEALLAKANRSIEAAEMLLARDDMADFAISRAYYAMFYVAEALLLEHGVELSKHSAVIGRYGQLFAKSGQLDPRFHRTLMAAQERRLIGDYRTSGELTADEARDEVAAATAFLAAAREYLGRRPAGDDA